MAPRRRHPAAVASMAMATKPPQRLRSIRSAACASIPRPPGIVSPTTGRIITSAQAAAADVSKPSRKNSCSRNPPHPPHPPAPARTIYTCPMHPQIRQVGPGSCPICGMALEPAVASLDAPPNAELADMTRRFWAGLVLALPEVVLEMGGHLVGGHGWVDQ